MGYSFTKRHQICRKNALGNDTKLYIFQKHFFIQIPLKTWEKSPQEPLSATRERFFAVATHRKFLTLGSTATIFSVKDIFCPMVEFS